MEFRTRGKEQRGLPSEGQEEGSLGDMDPPQLERATLSDHLHQSQASSILLLSPSPKSNLLHNLRLSQVPPLGFGFSLSATENLGSQCSKAQRSSWNQPKREERWEPPTR